METFARVAFGGGRGGFADFWKTWDKGDESIASFGIWRLGAGADRANSGEYECPPRVIGFHRDDTNCRLLSLQ